MSTSPRCAQWEGKGEVCAVIIPELSDSRWQERLINRGYAVRDAAIREFVDDSLPKPEGFPYT